MSFVNFDSNEIISKIVYYGPSLGGKTTNIRYINDHTKDSSKGKLISLATESDRTLFFDFIPLALGKVNKFNVRFHLYGVPGQIFYDTSRKMLLKGVDGIVFVADSTPNRFEANTESMNDLVKNLHLAKVDIADIPMVVQYNKRDVNGATPVNELCYAINKINAPEFESIATEGIGVFETLKGVSKLIMTNLKNEIPEKRPEK